MKEFYLYTFESTHGAISTEKILKPLHCTVMPVPRYISTSCGISVAIDPDQYEESRKLFDSETDLEEDEYKIYFVREDKDKKFVEATPVDELK